MSGLDRIGVTVQNYVEKLCEILLRTKPNFFNFITELMLLHIVKLSLCRRFY